MQEEDKWVVMTLVVAKVAFIFPRFVCLSKKRRRRPRESAQDMTEKVVRVVETIRWAFNYTKDSLGEWLLVKLSPLQFANLHSHEKSLKREEERRNGPV